MTRRTNGQYVGPMTRRTRVPPLCVVSEVKANKREKKDQLSTRPTLSVQKHIVIPVDGKTECIGNKIVLKLICRPARTITA